MASNYWRIAGRPKEAIDCLRKTIFYAPIQFKHHGLLSLANVFHRTHNSLDAVSSLGIICIYFLYLKSSETSQRIKLLSIFLNLQNWP